MADKKLTDIATTASLAASDLLYIVRGGTTDFAITAQNLASGIPALITGIYQPLDDDLTAIALLATTAYGRSTLELANASAARTLFGLIIGTDVLSPSGSGANLTALNASQLSSGTVATARLGSGTANSTTFLRGDQTWAVVTSGAPTDATYITQTPSGSLSAEQALSVLATGIVKNTTATGVLSIAAAGTDYLSPASTLNADNVTGGTITGTGGLVRANSPAFGAITATSYDGLAIIAASAGLTMGSESSISLGANASLEIAANKMLTVSSTITLAGTDGSTLNIGAGGTLGTAAYTEASAYQPADADLTTWAGITPGAGVATFLATPSSANLASAVTGETGSGALVFATSPSLVTPTLGVATSTSLAVTSAGSAGAPSLSVGHAAVGFIGSAGVLQGVAGGEVFFTCYGSGATRTFQAAADFGGNYLLNVADGTRAITFLVAAQTGFLISGTSKMTLTATALELVAGHSLKISSGTNQRAGDAVLVGGTVTVSNTTVTANTRIFAQRKTAGGTIGMALTYTLSAGTSFTLTSDNILDTSTYSYLLIEVAA